MGSRRTLGVLALAALAVGSACRSPVRDEPRVLAAGELELDPGDGPAGFATRELFASPLLSAHVTRVGGPLGAHVHADHEETVYVIRGTARMRIGATWHELAAGDLVHVPRGVVHEVADADATVLSLFAPPFDGADRVFVDAVPAAPRSAAGGVLEARAPRGFVPGALGNP
jgi:uncharacterized RmlC-like cupin family protein